jgi:hypothetical protein
MDMESYRRWYDYSRARDLMFGASDSAHAPWWVAPSDFKKNVRLNIISHILSQIPYEELPRDKPVLPKRGKRGDYVESRHPFRIIPQTF